LPRARLGRGGTAVLAATSSLTSVEGGREADGEEENGHGVHLHVDEVAVGMSGGSVKMKELRR
jgi:hypothetical protein